MKRYYALTLKTLDMGWVPENEHEPYGRYEVVMADEAEAEIKRLRDALESVRDMPWYDQDDPLRLRNTAREALNAINCTQVDTSVDDSGHGPTISSKCDGRPR